jgi:hypothetical protein
VDQYGSAEREEEEEQSNTLVQRTGVIATLGPPALGTHHTYAENQVPISPARGGSPKLSTNRGSDLQHGQVWIFGLVSLLLLLGVMDEV